MGLYSEPFSKSFLRGIRPHHLDALKKFTWLPTNAKKNLYMVLYNPWRGGLKGVHGWMNMAWFI